MVLDQREVWSQSKTRLTAYVQKNFRSIAHEQERILRIRHIGLPRVRIGFDSIDDLILAEEAHANGAYNPYTDEVWLNYESVTYPLHGLWGRLGLYSAGRMTADDALRHELGHYFADKRSEAMGRGSWPSNVIAAAAACASPPCGLDADFTKEKLLMRLVSEGIGRWFESNGRERDTFSYDELPADPWTIDPIADKPVFYRAGLHLVKPILDRYRARGVDYLVTHLPRVDSLRDLPRYQQEALRVLREGTP